MTCDFQSLDLNSVRAAMEKLFEQVLRHQGRVEVMRDGQSCVLISKTELESLEKALEILSSSGDCRQMEQLVAQIASRDAGFEATAPAP